MARLPYGQAAGNRLLQCYKSNARRRGKEWGLSNDLFFYLVKQSCKYCGSPPAQEYLAGLKRTYGPFRYNGIDRINNEGGYTPDNVAPCCVNCNRAKNQQPLADFEAWLRQVALHYSKVST